MKRSPFPRPGVGDAPRPVPVATGRSPNGRRPSIVDQNVKSLLNYTLDIDREGTGLASPPADPPSPSSSTPSAPPPPSRRRRRAAYGRREDGQEVLSG
ncbi:hypothetical protein chiPu_0031619 [Chiloscyllium punctatum]|uniref:Uncharacterized protein n=1 Tax=Chiloscyllium punctatum TaxID=137246 RepID=A0A401TY29_CHIPU|nr:hypothetical protein [Chiloscyllium punctatum]